MPLSETRLLRVRVQRCQSQSQPSTRPEPDLTRPSERARESLLNAPRRAPQHSELHAVGAGRGRGSGDGDLPSVDASLGEVFPVAHKLPQPAALRTCSLPSPPSLGLRASARAYCVCVRARVCAV
eukprot:3711407-Rhodomonas_salina.1